MTVGEYLLVEGPGKQAVYKDCLVDDIIEISRSWCVLVLKLPEKHQGYVQEIVHTNTLIELRDN